MRLTASVVLLPVVLLLGCDSLTEPSEFRVVKEGAAADAAPEAKRPAPAANDAQAPKPGAVAVGTERPNTRGGARPADQERAAARDQVKAKRADDGHGHAPGGSCGD